jgi:hypothetical protein
MGRIGENTAAPLACGRALSARALARERHVFPSSLRLCAFARTKNNFAQRREER